MKYLCRMALLWLMLPTATVKAQSSSSAPVDSFNLQRVTIQDTFLLRIVPHYIKFRLNAPGEARFQTKGVLVVIIPRERTDSTIRYRIRTEYDNYGLMNRLKFLHPLLYTQIAGRFTIICDEWTGTLVPLSFQSQQRMINEFAKSGWLELVGSPAESSMELHSSAYILRRPTRKKG